MDETINIKTITRTPFYNIATVLYDFANWDTTVRLNRSVGTWCNDSSSDFEPHEIYLGKTKKILSGIISSISHMTMSILHIKHVDSNFYKEYGFPEYSFLRYHYYVYCHAVSTIHDLLLKSVAMTFNFSEKTSWNNVRSNLKDIDEDKVITVFNDFFSTIESHKLKQNKVSHEGLLTYKTLNYHHLTCVWTQSHKECNQENQHPEYTEGTIENKEFLASKKEDFIKELYEATNDITRHIVSLFDLLLPRLIKAIPPSFIEKHREHLKDLKQNDINKYLLNDN